MVLFPVIRVWTAGNVPVARNIGPIGWRLDGCSLPHRVAQRPLVTFVGGLHGSGGMRASVGGGLPACFGRATVLRCHAACTQQRWLVGGRCRLPPSVVSKGVTLPVRATGGQPEPTACLGDADGGSRWPAGMRTAVQPLVGG